MQDPTLHPLVWRTIRLNHPNPKGTHIHILFSAAVCAMDAVGINKVPTRCDVEQNLKVVDGADTAQPEHKYACAWSRACMVHVPLTCTDITCTDIPTHRPPHPKLVAQTGRPHIDRSWICQWDLTRGWLQPSNSSERGRHTNAAAHVASKPTRRAASSNDGSLSRHQHQQRNAVQLSKTTRLSSLCTQAQLNLDTPLPLKILQQRGPVHVGCSFSRTLCCQFRSCSPHVRIHASWGNSDWPHTRTKAQALVDSWFQAAPHLRLPSAS